MAGGGSGTDPTLCIEVPWDVDTDESLGGATQEWEESLTPDDLTTALGADECIFDPDGATIITDGMTGCIKGATAGIGTGSLPTFSIRTIRIRKITPGGKKRLKKK